MSKQISVVVPLYNEEESLGELTAWIDRVMKANGFEAFFFLGAMMLTIAIYLRSNAKDEVQDPKAVKIDLSVFSSDAAFNWGALGVVVVLTILYYCLW